MNSSPNGRVLPFDVEANRRSRKWSNVELGKRVLWALLRPLFSLSPRIIWGWRRMLLRCFGAEIGNNVHIYPTVQIIIPNLTIGDGAAVGDRAILYALGPITIGGGVTISQGAHLCAGTHD
jgi:putative colanic acid biosynthesis acetyltransferase WcaF